MKALILAAGKGERLAADRPKCLLPVNGRPVLAWVLDSLAGAGVDEAVVVTGYRGELLREAFGDKAGTVRLAWQPAPDWELGNGASARAGELRLLHEDSFLLLMSDHLVAPELVRAIATHDLRDNLLAVGIDRDPTTIFDIDDGMKVKTDGRGRVTAIDKGLTGYDGIDCGVFVVRPGFFSCLAAAAAAGAHSLSRACALAAADGLMGTVDITGRPWHDLDTPASVAAAGQFYFSRL